MDAKLFICMDMFFLRDLKVDFFVLVVSLEPIGRFEPILICAPVLLDPFSEYRSSRPEVFCKKDVLRTGLQLY